MPPSPFGVCLQPPLAESQGGSDDDSQRYRANVLDTVSQMGQETVTSPESDFTRLSTSICSLAETVNSMKRDIENMKSGQSPGDFPNKRPRTESYNESDSDVETFFQNQQDEVTSGETDEWLDMADFFESEEEAGEDIISELASLANSSLRGKAKREKLKQLETKHKRPKNVENLQVLKVDEMLWRQLRPQTKSYDFSMQKMQKLLCLALVPTLKLMQHFKMGGEKQEARELVGDIYKALIQGYVDSNDSRREKIRNDVLPQYKKLCEEPSSSNKLFGDKLEESIKKMKETTTSLTRNITMSHRKPFLLNRGGRINAQIKGNKKTYAPNFFPPGQRTNKPYKQQQGRYQPRKGKWNRK